MREIKDVNEFNELIKSDKVTVVDFTATWCGPCKIMGPEFEKLAEEYPDFMCAKLDVDKVEDIASKYAISALPTFIFFSNGHNADNVVGAADPAKLREKFERFKKSA